MKEIWKYELALKYTDITMPMGAKILSFQCQKNTPTIWILVDPNLVCDGEKEVRSFVIYGTGHGIIEVIETLEYIGTAQQYDGDYVWHLFERKGEAKNDERK